MRSPSNSPTGSRRSCGPSACSPPCCCRPARSSTCSCSRWSASCRAGSARWRPARTARCSCFAEVGKFLQKEDIVPDARRQAAVQAGARTSSSAPVLLVYLVVPFGPDAALRQPRRRHLLRPRRVVDLGDRHPHRRLGVGQQVLAARRPARRRPAHRLRAAAGARRGRRRDPGRHAQPAAASSPPRPTARSSASAAIGNPYILTQFVGLRSSSSSPCRPSSPRRRSTCRSPSPSSSPATSPSTRACGSCCSSSASSPPPARSPRSPPRCSSAAGPCPALDARQQLHERRSGRSSCSPRCMLIGGLIFWVRFTYPRFREDQLQRFAWTSSSRSRWSTSWSTAVLKVVF